MLRETILASAADIVRKIVRDDQALAIASAAQARDSAPVSDLVVSQGDSKESSASPDIIMENRENPWQLEEEQEPNSTKTYCSCLVGRDYGAEVSRDGADVPKTKTKWDGPSNSLYHQDPHFYLENWVGAVWPNVSLVVDLDEVDE